MKGERVYVMAIKPFSRWAVLPESLAGDEAALPFYRRRNAEAFRAVWAERFPTSPVSLYRKRFWRKVVPVAEGPNPNQAAGSLASPPQEGE